MPLHFTETELLTLLNAHVWPFIRIGAMMMVAPVFGVALVPVRIRILLALGLTMVIAPLLPAPPPVSPVSLAGLLILLNQFLIGLAMGFALSMVFDAMIIGGQTIAMSMGLGFATMVDPQRGVNVPLVSQYFLILTTLLFLSLNGHLMLVQVLVDSFFQLPVGQGGIDQQGLWELVLWGGRMFIGAMQIALPAVIALMVVNLSFGVMSRAAPTLNLFAVGFPITMTLGFVIVLLSLPSLTDSLSRLLTDAFSLIARMLTGA